MARFFDDTGTVIAEYIAVLVLVSLGLAFATYALGPRLVALFNLQRTLLSIPML